LIVANRQLEQRRELAQLVRAARESAGLSQGGLAAAMTAAGEPTDRRQVNRWERWADAADDAEPKPGGLVISAPKLLVLLRVTRRLAPQPDRDRARLVAAVSDLEREIDRLRAQLRAAE
jgi:hypothetical protein